MPNKNNVTRITDQREFKKLILDKLGLHIVRFCAEWSGPSQMMAPVYDELSKIFQYRASFYVVDIDEAPVLKKELNVSELPTALFYKDGVLIGKAIGMQSKSVLIERFENALNNKY